MNILINKYIYGTYYVDITIDKINLDIDYRVVSTHDSTPLFSSACVLCYLVLDANKGRFYYSTAYITKYRKFL